MALRQAVTGDREIGRDVREVRIVAVESRQAGARLLRQAVELVQQVVYCCTTSGDAAASLLDQDLKAVTGRFVKSRQELVEVDRRDCLVRRYDGTIGEGRRAGCG